MLGAILLAVPLSFCLPIAAMTGWRYLRRADLVGWQWPAAWMGSATAAFFVEGWLIWSAISESHFPLGIRLPVGAAAAMIAVLVMATITSQQHPATRISV